LHATPLSFCPKQDEVILAEISNYWCMNNKIPWSSLFRKYRGSNIEHIEALKKNSKSVRYVEIEESREPSHSHLTHHPDCIASLICEFFKS
jgi:hypothetical protein